MLKSIFPFLASLKLAQFINNETSSLFFYSNFIVVAVCAFIENKTENLFCITRGNSRIGKQIKYPKIIELPFFHCCLTARHSNRIAFPSTSFHIFVPTFLVSERAAVRNSSVFSITIISGQTIDEKKLVLKPFITLCMHNTLIKMFVKWWKQGSQR